MDLRIFISSPGDVPEERAIAKQVIDTLNYDPQLRDRVVLQAIAWDGDDERVPLLATKTPQKSIEDLMPEASECDIVIVILWSRIGTPLPPEFVKSDGNPYLSGTEYEFWDAYNAAQDSTEKPTRPHVVLYRCTRPVRPDLEDPKYDELVDQYRKVQAFFKQFTNEDKSIKGGINSYATPDEFGKLLQDHLKPILKLILNAPELWSQRKSKGGANALELWKGSPFPGLRSFTLKDAPIFFGRSSEIGELVEKLGDKSKPLRFLCIVGASGSGKSSLIAAGLLPRLLANALLGGKDWKWTRFTPGGAGDNPFMALASALITDIPAIRERYSQPGPLASALEKQEATLAEINQLALEGTSELAELLLYIDQFEELFTIANKDYHAPFVHLIDAATKLPRLRIIATVRADFYDRCVTHVELAELLQYGSYPLAAPRLSALYEMIARPAERAALAFQDGLVQQILDDANSGTGRDPGALALMAYALDELFQATQNTESKILTQKVYESLGGVQGAIGTRAAAVFETLDIDTQDALQDVFRELVEVDDRGVATRRTALYQQVVREKDSPAGKLVDKLIDARLLVIERNQQDEVVVTVAHEALLRSWPRLKKWIEDTQEDRRLLRQVKLAALEWFNAPEKTEDEKKLKNQLRWNHERLLPIPPMLERFKPNLDPTTKEFITPEFNRLIHELSDINTSDIRRARIGERLDEIGDLRRGVGLDTQGIPDIKWHPISAPTEQFTSQDKSGFHYNCHVPTFYISEFLVTYNQYSAFSKTADYKNPIYWENMGKLPNIDPSVQVRQIGNHPVDNVTWYEAVAFCNWLTEKLRVASRLPIDSADWSVRLPTSWEWQWVASGIGKNKTAYPWGEDWRPNHANTEESGHKRTIAVGMYPADQTIMDMVGNVDEWMLNLQRDLSCNLKSDNERAVQVSNFDTNASVAKTSKTPQAFKPKPDRFDPRRIGRSGFRIVFAPLPIEPTRQ